MARYGQAFKDREVARLLPPERIQKLERELRRKDKALAETATLLVLSKKVMAIFNKGPPTTHIATAPGQVWCWDMAYLPATVQGRWFHLYLILDLYSRKIIGWGYTTATTPTMLRILCVARRWPGASPPW